ncbi:unnamed protein product [Hyaloperonospora brassicae]|uniref:Protein preY, mitochondrial n=1 Tax=Hyaloperonospora brassicae TaxID=162125 RepID=A0AAV0UC13_HYABA|nr:unnamed protein product [Hyaloperonospora brassicae]
MESVGRLASRAWPLRPQGAHRSGVATQRLTRRRLGTLSRFDRAARLLDETVLEHLVCPISKFPVRYDTERGSLVCDEISVEYPIWYGVPVLVPSEGRILEVSSNSDDQHDDRT